MKNAKDLTKEAPRSPYEEIASFAILARTIDKCRAYLNDTAGEYHFDCAMDKMLFSFMEINAGEFKNCVASGADDAEIGQWVKDHGTQKTDEEIKAWSDHFKTDYSYATDPNKSAWFVSECKRLGLEPTTTTLFDYLEADDKASFQK